MYTDDEKFKETQKDHARDVIEMIANKYTSNIKRQQEFDFYWGVYQSFGDWQDALNILEERMVLLGRKEYNHVLFVRYTEEMRKLIVPHDKAEYTPEDYRILGYSQAYSVARYAVRFHDLHEAIDFMDERLKESSLDHPSDKYKVECLIIIVDQLRKLATPA